MNNIKHKLNIIKNNPKAVAIKALQMASPLLSDKTYLKLIFPIYTGYLLNLKHPTTFNQKLQWLKLYYRRPEMTQMVDKAEAKVYAKQYIDEKYIIKTLGVWDSFEEIDFNKLPNSFVLKTTHDQGGVIIVKDKQSFDKAKARTKLNKHLKRKHFYLSREWPYKNVPPRIMAEELLSDDSALLDYKFYCFHGEPKVMYISYDYYMDIFDMDFKKLPIERRRYKNSHTDYTMPDNWELMIDLAKIISEDFPHIRVDFYNIKGKVYLGEMTFFQGGGLMPFYPQHWDTTFGSWIDLDAVKQELGVSK